MHGLLRELLHLIAYTCDISACTTFGDDRGVYSHFVDAASGSYPIRRPWSEDEGDVVIYQDFAGDEVNCRLVGLGLDHFAVDDNGTELGDCRKERALWML
ncbi:hypothetical protein N7457_005563 [Penicillium paradoxum]|uniref:uncharacterized protein n=1 Tax=Penicillium paradoxum TaxID=176176 RepID=UPI0025499344|nr:uncharacterized protein N7457_005563 [Penicillium paradoxum]KAJ5780403.1 hypothetical protein N7457_005563 [Penicillium paradoxum]